MQTLLIDFKITKKRFWRFFIFGSKFEIRPIFAEVS